MVRRKIDLDGDFSADDDEDIEPFDGGNAASLLSVGLTRKGGKPAIDLTPAARASDRLERQWATISEDQRIVREKDLVSAMGDQWGQCFQLELAGNGRIAVRRSGQLTGNAHGQHSAYDVAMLIEWLSEIAAVSLRRNQPLRERVDLPEAETDMCYEAVVAPWCDSRGQPCGAAAMIECLGQVD